jgi:hypothetical protein
VRSNSTSCNNLSVGNSGGGASHAVLYLTNNRSFQQARVAQTIREIKNKMRGKQFMLLLAPPKFCRRNPIAKVEFMNGKVTKVTLSKINCNSWRCPNCSKLKAIKARYLIRETAVLNNLFYFLTLTLDPSKIPLDYLSEGENRTHEYILKIFNTFATDLRRKTNVPLKYIWVLEFQKNRRAHLHILLNQYIDKKLIDEIWIRVGGGKITWVTKAQSVEALSFYLSNYIVKGLKNDRSDKSYFQYFQRRFSISQNCIRPLQQNLALFSEEKIKELKTLELDWVYNALAEEQFDDEVVLFEDK